MLSAGQWFMIAGVAMFLFGLGLIAVLISSARRAKQARRRLVARVIERVDLREVSVIPGGFGHGFSIEAARQHQLRRIEAPYRTGQRALDATRLDLRRSGGGHRGVRP